MPFAGEVVNESLFAAAEVTVTSWVAEVTFDDEAVIVGVPAIVSLYLNVIELAPSGMITLVITVAGVTGSRNVPAPEVETRVTVRDPTEVGLFPASRRSTVIELEVESATIETGLLVIVSCVVPTRRLEDLLLSVPTQFVPITGVTV